VALTVVVIALVPEGAARGLFGVLRLGRFPLGAVRAGVSCASAAVLLAAVWCGIAGTQDPTHNPLPVLVWTVFWVGLVLVQGLIGDVWAWVNPWTGPLAILRRAGLRPKARLPAWAGLWPAVVLFLGFAGFLLADPAPRDPDRLAVIAMLWWAGHLVLAAPLGRGWLRRGEPLTALMDAYAGVAAFGPMRPLPLPPSEAERGAGHRSQFLPSPCGRGVGGEVLRPRGRGEIAAGLWGWRAVAGPAPGLSFALFMIALLAVGSFDGLYQTFWWFGLTGQNPLEFAGRSAVIGISLAGLAAAVPALALAYACCLWLGLRLAGGTVTLGDCFRRFAPALLPIALAYHFAHYLPALLVEMQAVPIVLNDPLGRGSDLFGLGHFEVTTGFFNRLDTVRVIWLTQAGGIVAGHVLGILMSHRIALDLFGSRRAAAVGQAPLAVFMVLYTLFGLWLLASPRGV
jgi:hypothetical protein